jgi:hypothetical protein
MCIIFGDFITRSIAILKNVLIIFSLLRSIIIFWGYSTFGYRWIALSNSRSLSKEDKES